MTDITSVGDTENVAKQSPIETIFTETEAAKFMKVSRMTVLRLRQKGQLKFYRVGFRVLYSLEKHITPFLDSCEESAA